MKIGIYAPYLEAYGGGEKYICKVAEILSVKNDVELIVFKEPNISELENRFNVNLSKVGINILQHSTFSKLPYIRMFANTYILSNVSAKYDLFINQERPSIIPSLAKRSILIYEIPPTRSNNLFWLYNNPLTSLLFDPKLRTYDKIITNSYYTKKWVEKWYGRDTEVLYPLVDTKEFTPLSKENIILSVGRFFIGSHCKKQLEMIKIFKILYNKSDVLKDWGYHLIGGVNNNIKNKEYLKRCQKEAQGYPIYFHINVPFKVLKTLYGKAKIFWHATGLGEDETKHPDRMEHFGITTGEAMSAGCVPVVINKGGQPELVRSMIDGFLWNTTEELKEYTIKLINNASLWRRMSQSSVERIQEFGLDKFKDRVKQIFMEVLK